MIRYSVVDNDHKICQETCPDDVGYFIKKFWESRELGTCDGAIVASKGDELVGFFRYYKRASYMDGPSTYVMYGAGTYVLSQYRKRGIAKKLWAEAIAAIKPRYIEVTATSTGAIKLLNVLKQKHPSIIWHIEKNL